MANRNLCELRQRKSINWENKCVFVLEMHIAFKCITMLSRSDSRVALCVCVSVAFFPNVCVCFFFRAAAVQYICCCCRLRSNGWPGWMLRHSLLDPPPESLFLLHRPAHPPQFWMRPFLWMNRKSSMCLWDAPAHAHTHATNAHTQAAERSQQQCVGFFMNGIFEFGVLFSIRRCLFYEWLSKATSEKSID